MSSGPAHRSFIVKRVNRHGFVEEYKTVVDQADAYLLRGTVWSICPADRNGNIYVARANQGAWQFLHRELAQARNTEFVEHINGNTLDNRKCNLKTRPISEKAAYMGKKANAMQGRVA